MKKKSIVISLILLILGLSSCGASPVEETPDGYIDVMPTSSESGVILQAFDWTFSEIENNLPAIANAGFKMIQTSPVQQPKNNGTTWWSFYQPLSFSIATSSPLGSKADLESLCTTAESYGISILCDIVFNHMANVGDSTLESDGTPVVSPDVATYEPYIYEHRNDSGTSATFHHNPNAAGSGAVTQVYSYGNLPDLNTANAYVQERCLSLLEECINAGVDGFRFDAAKHIETPNDPQYSSDFWPNVLGVAKTYYTNKTGNNLFAYGEVLNDPDGGRTIDLYTPYMKVTDNTYISQVVSGSANNDAERVLSSPYGKNTEASNLVTWVESHDTYIDSTQHSKEMRTAQRWAVIASRKDTSCLFLARPNDNLTVGEIGSYQFKDEIIGVTNRFHNRFIGADEEQTAEDAIYVNERYSDTSAGAMIVNFAGAGTETVTFSHLGTGVYYNQLTGEAVTVRNNSAKITFDDSGIVVLTMSKNIARPTISVSQSGVSFFDSLAIDITVTNSTNAYYTINGGTPVAFTDQVSFTLGDVTDENNQIALYIYAENSQFSVHQNLTYTKVTIIDGYFNIVNLNSQYYTDYELYFWAWSGANSGHWLSDYTVQDDIVLIDFSATSYTSFLFATFEKGHVISNLDAWDSNKIKQSNDILISDIFYNASNF
ncbi:MAG: alpha-amylase family glycosyl hydrolase [Bacilli bacterium]